MPVALMAVFTDGCSSPKDMLVLSRDVGNGVVLFREDSFDVMARTRRRRFYESAGKIKESPVISQHLSPTDIHAFPRKQLHHFRWASSKPAAKLVAIGVEDSLWRILNAERISTGEWLVTLKARGGVGLLPEVDDDKIPEFGRAAVVKAVGHMVDVAHRETPGSIVDVARNTAALLLAVYAADQETDAEKQRRIMGQDLGDVCKHFRNHAALKKLEVVTSTGHILARLHPRNKPNEQHQRGLRLVTEDDATFAVSAIGLLLNEFQWTRASP